MIHLARLRRARRYELVQQDIDADLGSPPGNAMQE